MTRRTITAPTCRGERMIEFGAAPDRRQWRLRVGLALSVIVSTTRIGPTQSFWRIEGLRGYEQDRALESGGPQAAANEAGKALEELAHRIQTMGRAA